MASDLSAPVIKIANFQILMFHLTLVAKTRVESYASCENQMMKIAPVAKIQSLISR